MIQSGLEKAQVEQVYTELLQEARVGMESRVLCIHLKSEVPR